MRKKNIKIISTLLIVIGLSIATIGLTIEYRATKEIGRLTTIRLPIDVWPGNFWIIIANEKGFFEEEGIKAKIVDVSANYNESVDEFIHGRLVDTQNLAVFDLVEANNRGANLVTVLVSDNSEGAEGLVAKKEYKELSDLKGKRIGVELGSYLEYFLNAAMLNVGIGHEEYTQVDIVTEDLTNNFATAKLDAAFSWEPDLSEMKEMYDLNIIFDTSDMRGLSPGIYAFKRKFIESNPEAIQGLINAWHKATNFLMNNKEEAYGIIAQVDFADKPGDHYSIEEIEKLVKLDPLLDLNDNMASFSFETGFESLYANLQFVSRFIQKTQGFNNIPNTNRMLTDEFIMNVKTH